MPASALPKSPRSRVRDAASTSRGGRRRLVDPTTCDREYRPDEIEFMTAVERYKRQSGRAFPTCCELLEVLRSLGYVRSEAESSPAV